MRHIHIPTELSEFEFVKKAAKKFESNSSLTTFTEDEMKDGLIAIKWGLDDDCILVFRIADKPRIYTQIINKNLGEKKDE